MTRVTVLATLVLDTVENTAWLRFAPSLKTPLSVIEKSAKSKSRSIADLFTPVTSCTPLGVAKSRLVISFSIDLAELP
jgi:hypothetical protein